MHISKLLESDKGMKSLQHNPQTCAVQPQVGHHSYQSYCRSSVSRSPVGLGLCLGLLIHALASLSVPVDVTPANVALKTLHTLMAIQIRPSKKLVSE